VADFASDGNGRRKPDILVSGAGDGWDEAVVPVDAPAGDGTPKLMEAAVEASGAGG